MAEESAAISHLLGLPAAKKQQNSDKNDFPAFLSFSNEFFVRNRGLVCTQSRDFQLSPITMHFSIININGAL